MFEGRSHWHFPRCVRILSFLLVKTPFQFPVGRKFVSWSVLLKRQASSDRIANICAQISKVLRHGLANWRKGPFQPRITDLQGHYVRPYVEWRLEWAFWLAKDFSVGEVEGTGTSVLSLSRRWLMAHSPLKDQWNLKRWGSLPITHLNNVRSMAEWHGPTPEDLSGLLLKLKGFMSDMAAYGGVCRWSVNKTVYWTAVSVSEEAATAAWRCKPTERVA